MMLIELDVVKDILWVYSSFGGWPFVVAMPFVCPFTPFASDGHMLVAAQNALSPCLIMFTPQLCDSGDRRGCLCTQQRRRQGRREESSRREEEGSMSLL